MRRNWGIIAGGSTLLLAGVVATQSGLLARFGGTAADPDTPAAAPPPPIEVVEPAPAAVVDAAPPIETAAETGAGDEIARLTAALADREAANARLETTLAVRDAVLKTLNATLAERETALAQVQADLAASAAEIETLRTELAALRGQAGFDQQLAALKPEGEPSAARLEAARVETVGLEAIFEAKAAPPAPAAVPIIEVHFDFASAALTPGGQANTAAAAVMLADMPLERVRVIGHTDRVGRPAANRRLATQRADAVAAFLVAAGLPRELIEIDGMGEADLPVATEDGVPEPLNRTVAIMPVPMPAG